MTVPAPPQSFVRSLRSGLRGDVHDDDGTRAAFAHDASNHRVVPLCVVMPRDAEDVVRLVRSCAEAGVAVTPRGAGTSVAGNAIGPGVVIDFSRYMDAVRDVDPETRTATVEPGAVLDIVQARAAPHGLTFGADPSTHNRCTLGGMVGTNACGSHSVAWGTTADNVEALEVVLADGSARRLDHHGGDGADPLVAELRRLGDTVVDVRGELGRFGRQMSGYGLQYLLPEHGFDLARAFVGSEGTCGLLTSVRLRLVPTPPTRALVVAGFLDDLAAAAAGPALLSLGPLTVEGIDAELVRAFDSRPTPQRRPALPDGGAWLLLEVGGSGPAEVAERAEALRRAAIAAGALGARLVAGPAEQRAFWGIRERGAGFATRTADGREAWPGWEDAAVPPTRLADYLGHFRELLGRYGRRGVVYGHFGEGCVHVRIDHDLLTPQGRAAYRAFQEDAADLVVAHGGSLSGEHGDGRARSELLPRMYSPAVLRAFAAFKHAFDPAGLLNPGVLVSPRPLDADLRLALARPHTEHLAFGYHDDDGDLGKAVRRCVGIGACRKHEGGGMCPSYRATRDERHSTRGRARLLFEMLDGDLKTDGWHSPEVKAALDLCLMCKACRNECPTTVDMATYKAEFLHQHYRRRRRPAAHYSMGWLPVWLAAGRVAPRVVNAVLEWPGVEPAVKRLGGIDPNRRIPRLAVGSFRRWFRRRPAPVTGEPVALWVDPFTASFTPEAARDAVAVLEAAGYRVTLTPRGACCGLTWVSTGQLGIARRVMARTVRLLAGGTVPIVVLEPSCAASLRTDLPELLGTESARELAGRVRTLAEALHDRELPAVRDATPVPAVAQFHCHQRAVIGTDADRTLLERVGVTVESVDEGCCGLAGNFGFEKGHDEVSRTCAEQSFLPYLDRADPSSPVLADGFSCRLQVAQLSGRRPVHLAQVLARRLGLTPTRGQ